MSDASENCPNALPNVIMNNVAAFYELSDKRFAEQVHEFTRNDPRLSLLFFTTRQHYQINKEALAALD